MPGKAIDNSANGCLVLIFPIALVMAILFFAWPVLLGLVLLGGSLRVVQNYQWQQWSQQLNPLFHQVLQENQGCVTPLDLAMKANLSGSLAKRYLETKAEEFGAQRRDLENRGSVYYFITASTLGSIFDDSEPSSLFEDESEDDRPTEVESAIADDQQPTVTDAIAQTPTDKLSLNQSQLARWLDVNPSTIHKRKFDSDFSEWSRSKDPQAIAWEYSLKTKLFSPRNNPRTES